MLLASGGKCRKCSNLYSGLKRVKNHQTPSTSDEDSDQVFNSSGNLNIQ